MSVFIASSILLVIGSAYAILLKRKLTETVFLAAITVAAVLYCFGLLNIEGCLLFGIYCLVLLALLCIVYFIYSFIKNRKILLNIEFFQGCILYICFLVLFFLLNYKMVFLIYDEFTHWGTIVKYFYSVDALGTFDNHKFKLISPFYPPGTSLFQYFFMRFSGRFTEYYAYIAQNILYCSLFLPFISNIFNKGKRVKLLLLSVMFLLLPLQSFGFYGRLYDSLFVDTILGVLFGFAVLYYFVYKYEESLYGILMVSAAVFMLSLAKEMGFLLSLGIMGIIAVDILFFKRSEIKKVISQKSGIFQKIKHIVIMVFPLIFILFFKISWSNIIKQIDTKLFNNNLNMDDLSFGSRIPLKDVFSLITNQGTQYQKETIKTFLSGMLHKPILTPYTGTLTLCIIFIVLVFFISLFFKDKLYSRRIVTAGLLIALGAFIYQFILMLSYVFIFRGYEVTILASYERYTSTYLLGMFFFCMIFYVSDQSVLDNEKTASFKYTLIDIIFFLVIVISSWKGLNGLLERRQMKPQVMEFRQPIADAVNKWRYLFDENNPYIIYQEGKVISLVIFNYELCPGSSLANAGRFDYYISPNYGNIAIFTVSPDEWEEYIISNEYKLLYVFKSDLLFKTTYGRFFPSGVKDDMAYYVENDNGHLSLIPAAK